MQSTVLRRTQIIAIPILLLALNIDSSNAASITVFDFSDGVTTVYAENSFCSLIDKSGKQIVTPLYDEVSFISEGMMAVKKNGKWGYMDKEGKQVIVPQFDDAHTFNEGMAAVSVKGKWGFVDKTGKQVTGPKFDYANAFSEGMAAVSVNGKRDSSTKLALCSLNLSFILQMNSKKDWLELK